MNHLLKSVAVILFVTTSLCCGAQQIVQTPKDVFIICQRDRELIGKPLKDLFKEIKPPIRLVLAEGGGGERAPHLTFFFTTIQVYKNYRRQDKFPLRLTVFLKEPFQWEWEERRLHKSREHYLDWTKEDEEKYGNLTIRAIRVAGEYNACDYEYNGYL